MCWLPGGEGEGLSGGELASIALHRAFSGLAHTGVVVGKPAAGAARDLHPAVGGGDPLVPLMKDLPAMLAHGALCYSLLLARSL